MNKEKLDKANLLCNQIQMLKDEKDKYSANGICHIQMQDHFRLYALPFELIQAMGYDLERKLSSDFKIYLESMCQMLNNRIDSLQKELDLL